MADSHRRTASDQPCREIRIELVVPHLTSSLPDPAPEWADTLEFAREAEAAGFDSLWVADDLLHRFPEGEPLGQGEWWSFRAALVASTSRVELSSRAFDRAN